MNNRDNWRRASELPPQRPQLDEAENANTMNNRHSTGGFGQQPQKKRVLATTTATAVTTMSKRRMSMKNRRVSFAPDPELTTIREFEKEEHASPAANVGGVHAQQLEQLPEGEPMMISPVQQLPVGERARVVRRYHGWTADPRRACRGRGDGDGQARWGSSAAAGRPGRSA